MTYITEAVTEYQEIEASAPVMAIVDELGRETPITEFDIRRSLKLMSDESLCVPNKDAIDILMERVEAARGIA